MRIQWSATGCNQGSVELVARQVLDDRIAQVGLKLPRGLNRVQRDSRSFVRDGRCGKQRRSREARERSTDATRANVLDADWVSVFREIIAVNTDKGRDYQLLAALRVARASSVG
jgi:hypothetical protein